MDFTDDVQQSLGEPGFLDLMEGLLAGRPPVKALRMDQLYDTQLAGRSIRPSGVWPPA